MTSYHLPQWHGSSVSRGIPGITGNKARERGHGMFLAKAIKAKSYKDWRKSPGAQQCEHRHPDRELACSDNIVC